MDFYLQLVLCTAGSVLYLFLLTLFAGLRRRKAFEVTLFLTGIAVFCFYSGYLLLLNARIQYASPPQFTTWFSGALILLGIKAMPPLIVHTHAAYLSRLDKARNREWVKLLVWAFYLGALVGTTIADIFFMDFWPVVWPWGVGAEGILAALAFAIAATMQITFATYAANVSHRRLHVALGFSFFALALIWLVPFAPYLNQAGLLIPGLFLGYFALRNQFLPAGFQRNLVFSVTAGFIALLYLTLARRLSDWLDPYFPPVATTSVLLFVLVVFFDPIQRRVGKILQRAFRAEAEQLQRLTAEIQHVARAGNLAELITFAESRIRESFSLSSVRISLLDGPARPATVSGNVQRFILRNGPVEIGVLEAYFFGQTLSGETHAALDYISEQLPAAIDLCRLLDEKLRLERELAERERLA
ncbi:MAG: hypothetical protein HY267_05875, partial [Deltaproteobacteria bacterium]|nr:hypothetical protein [Deltaproteobacteria bacterium]